MKFAKISLVLLIITLLVQQRRCFQEEEEDDGSPIMSDGHRFRQELVSAMIEPLHLKDTYPKDISVASNKRAIVKMQSRISSMEHSINGIYQGVQSIKSKTNKMESSLSKQETLLDKLDKGFSDMERVLSTHTDVLDELNYQLGPNDRAFASSNQTCGGVLFARSGSITYSATDLTHNIDNPSLYKPLHCVWTIQAGHHSQINIKLHDLKLPAHLKLYAVELVTHANGNYSSLQTTRTRVLTPSPTTTQILHGPVAFIVLTRNNSDMYMKTHAWSDTITINLNLEYEGRGKVKQKGTQLFHHQLPAYSGSGNFSDRDLETWRDGGLESYFNDDGNYAYKFSESFGTVLLANLSTKAIFKLELDRGKCTNDSVFIVISDLLQNGTLLTDLCKTDPLRWETGVAIYGTPVAFLIGMKSDPFGAGLPFRVRWDAETPFPSSSKGTENCGGILGGPGGTITYRTATGGSSGAIRCVWVIAPQPEMGSSIWIKRGWSWRDSGIQLSLVELPDTNKSGYAASSLWRNYPVSGREVYIIFQSQSDTPAYLMLEWRVAVGAGKSGKDMNTLQGYTWLQGVSGSVTSRGEGEDTPYSRRVFVIQRPPPSTLTTFSFPSPPNMKLVLSQRASIVGDGNCLGENVTVYTLIMDILLELSKEACDNSGNVTIDNTDGLAVIIMNLQNQTSPNITLNYEWRDTGARVEARCGGVMKGRSGLIEYKLNKRYYHGNERCIWLIHTPNCTQIRMTLLYGFYGTRYIVANTIDPASGSLRNDSVFFNSETRRHTISEGFVVLLFQPVDVRTQFGFSISYSGLQCESVSGTASSIHYHITQYRFPNRRLTYRPADDDPEGLQGSQSEIYVIAYSQELDFWEGTYANSIVIDFNHGEVSQMNNDSSCTYDSLKVYGMNEDEAIHHSGGWDERLSYQEGSVEGVCPHNNTFRSKYFAFLAIYKFGSVTGRNGEVEFNLRIRKVANSNSTMIRSTVGSLPPASTPSSSQLGWGWGGGSQLGHGRRRISVRRRPTTNSPYRSIGSTPRSYYSGPGADKFPEEPDVSGSGAGPVSDFIHPSGSKPGEYIHYSGSGSGQASEFIHHSGSGSRSFDDW